MEEEHKPDASLEAIFAKVEPPAPKPRRWMLVALMGLYGVSALAALVLIFRGSAPEASDRKPNLLRRGRFLTAMREPGIAWVPIHGAIYGSASGRPWEHGMEQWNKRIQTLADKPEVKAIILDINSPGGSVGAVQELYRTIQRVREEKKKPVITVVGDVAASGGFYLAAACDKVVVHPGSLVGSIGVIFQTMNVEQLLAKIGVKSEPVKSGKMKDIGSPTRKMTPEERALLQALIDDAYGQFLGAVAKGRNMPIEKLKPLADGRIFSGQQALELGLVDVIGDSQDAIALAAKLAGINGKPRIIRDGDSLESVLEMLDSSLSGFLRPESRLFSAMPSFSVGLEYRWMGI